MREYRREQRQPYPTGRILTRECVRPYYNALQERIPRSAQPYLRRGGGHNKRICTPLV